MRVFELSKMDRRERDIMLKGIESSLNSQSFSAVHKIDHLDDDTVCKTLRDVSTWHEEKRHTLVHQQRDRLSIMVFKRHLNLLDFEAGDCVSCGEYPVTLARGSVHEMREKEPGGWLEVDHEGMVSVDPRVHIEHNVVVKERAQLTGSFKLGGDLMISGSEMQIKEEDIVVRAREPLKVYDLQSWNAIRASLR